MKRLLIPRQSKHPEDEKDVFFEKSLSTGILNWQELGHLDFGDLLEQTRQRSVCQQETDE